MKSIHQRMPVIIDNNNMKGWLGKQVSSDDLQNILVSDTYQKMVQKKVSDWVNNPYHNDNNCLN